MTVRGRRETTCAAGGRIVMTTKANFESAVQVVSRLALTLFE